MSAREEILERLRGALQDVDTPAWPGAGRAAMPVGGPYGVDDPPTAGGAGDGTLLERFTEVVEDYRATVVPVCSDQVAGAVALALTTSGARSVVLPDGLDPGWADAVRAAGLRVHVESAVGIQELDAVDAVVTASAVAIAATGTIVLDHGPDQGRRALSLVPDVHVCVVRADQVVAGVPHAVARLRPTGGAQRPLTWISGPSATSDIELERVEGVHGPRTLVVVLDREA